MRSCKYVMVEEKISMEQQAAAALLTLPKQLEAVSAEFAEERKQGSVSSELHVLWSSG